MKNAMIALYAAVRSRVYAFTHEEKGAVDIVAIVVMIGIAVLLAVVFKKQVEGLIKTLVEGIQTKAQKSLELNS